jgi:metal-responsive CopG/Arc/MetJ family transcriptional regulator
MEPVKTAISIPDPLFKAADRMARERGLSRSELYATALRAYLEVHGAEAITARLDALYPLQESRLDPAVARAQQQLIDDEAW